MSHCKHECGLKDDIAHCRNRETRHLAEMGEMAAELESLKTRQNVLEKAFYDLQKEVRDVQNHRETGA